MSAMWRGLFGRSSRTNRKPNEASDLQRQRHQCSPIGAPALARRIQARCCVPSGVESASGEISGSRYSRSRLWRDLAGAEESWNGVAILARGADPVESRRGLPGDPEDMHSRYIEALINGLRVGCLYLPNGNPAPGPKFDYKLRWLERLTKHAQELLATAEPVVLAGDYNVIPADIDVYKPERWLDDALFMPEVRSAFASLVAMGWTDAVLKLHPDERIFTFWDYFRNAFMREAGLRIDHLLLSPSAAARLVSAGVDREVRGWEKASDHAPTWIVIAEGAQSR